MTIDRNDCKINRKGQSLMKNLLQRLKNEESGQGMVEYGLILALVAIVVIVILTTMGGNLKNLFSKTSDTLGSAVSAASTVS